MARLLLIDPDRRALVALQKALRDAGYTSVTAVPSGSFALTMVERDRPDLIVSRLRIPDIGGAELCAIIRTDPALKGVRLLLLAESADEIGAEGERPQADRIVVGDVEAAAVVAEIQSVLASASTGAPVVTTRPSTARGLRGSLAVMDLAEVTQAIALGGKTGQLLLTLAAGPGVIVFDRGRVVHAQFLRLTGEAAFGALLATSHRDCDGTFVFNPLAGEADAAQLPHTIDRSVDSLLLSMAAEIDEGGIDVTGAQTRR